MKLVLDVDEDTIQNLFDSRYVSECIKDIFRIDATPLEKVLEDIKAEITNERDNKGFCVWYYDDLMKKINKHISGKEQSE